LTEQKDRAAFARRYGPPATVRAAAPGRVNLIGGHTDYNDGFVLPIATPQETNVLMASRLDRGVRLWSGIAGSEGDAGYSLGTENRAGTWDDYVAGVTAVLGRGSCDSWFRCRHASTVPLGAGLSSSASLEVAVLRALNDLFALGLDAVGIARLAHVAETQFVGVPVGIMDQMAASLGARDSALFIDTRSLTYQHLPLPAETALIVIDSGVTHQHAWRRLSHPPPRMPRGRQAPGRRQPSRRNPGGTRGRHRTAAQRARHVITEDDRVLRARQALQDGDVLTLGTLMNASHASLRDDFVVSVPDVDSLVALTQSEPGVLGARLTGSGFSRSIVAPAWRAQARSAARRVAALYSAHGPFEGVVVLP
jgi:galactokinase